TGLSAGGAVRRPRDDGRGRRAGGGRGPGGDGGTAAAAGGGRATAGRVIRDRGGPAPRAGGAARLSARRGRAERRRRGGRRGRGAGARVPGRAARLSARRAGGVRCGLVGRAGRAVRCGSVLFGGRAPAAPEDDGGHEEHRAGPAGQWGGPGGGPAVGAGGVRAGTEVAVAVGGRLQALRLEPVRGPQRGGGVDETEAPGVVAAAGGGVAGGVRQEGLELRRGEVGVGGAQQGDGAGDERGGGTGAPALV